MNDCRLCPRECGVNRESGEVGYCGASSDMVIARYSLHMWEEPCISGKNGSGTIFFSFCNLRCIFCQNYEISTLHRGRVVSVEEFSDICLKLQDKGASNINLVTGVMYVPLIIEGINLAKSKGLTIPVVYNSSGYESIDTIKMLEGVVDIYLPDFKYYSNDLAFKYSKCSNYFECASGAIDEMYSQVGEAKFDSDGNMIKGVIIRHLVLPGSIDDSKRVIKYLYNTYGDHVFISIMNQYTPIRWLEVECLNRKIKDYEYNEVVNYAYDLGVRKAFIQEEETQTLSFIPDFLEFDGC